MTTVSDEGSGGKGRGGAGHVSLIPAPTSLYPFPTTHLRLTSLRPPKVGETDGEW